MPSKINASSLLILSCLCAIAAGAWGCRSTSTPAPAPGERSRARKIIDPRANPPAECERRAVAMAAQDRSLKEDPDPGDWSGQVPEQGTLSGNSPCDQVATSRTQDDRDNAAVLARTRASMFLQQGRPALAREALEAAFEEGTRSTPELRNLALDIQDALHAIPENERPEGGPCKLQKMESVGVDANATHAIEGPSQIVLTCDTLPLPNGVKKNGTRELVVQLRQRSAPGKFTVLAEKRPGALNEIALPFQQIFSLPTKGEEVEAIFYDVNLLAVRAGHPPDFIARRGVFWFAR